MIRGELLFLVFRALLHGQLQQLDDSRPWQSGLRRGNGTRIRGRSQAKTSEHLVAAARLTDDERDTAFAFVHHRFLHREINRLLNARHPLDRPTVLTFLLAVQSVRGGKPGRFKCCRGFRQDDPVGVGVFDTELGKNEVSVSSAARTVSGKFLLAQCFEAKSNHAVQVRFDRDAISVLAILRVFFRADDPVLVSREFHVRF